ncbi:MAG TPA: hypothetical protein DCM05_04255 [Elusimicrobia bacterium]|nr:hypothetical protein [Elusimicrobiota bacterium]
MAKTKKLANPHMKIVVGLPDIQDQLRLVNRSRDKADEHEAPRWASLGLLLEELYVQLEHQKKVVVYRLTNKSRSKSDVGLR